MWQCISGCRRIYIDHGLQKLLNFLDRSNHTHSNTKNDLTKTVFLFFHYFRQVTGGLFLSSFELYLFDLVVCGCAHQCFHYYSLFLKEYAVRCFVTKKFF